MNINPFTLKSDLIDFTLSKARRFYSSKRDPLGVQGLKAIPGRPAQNCDQYSPLLPLVTNNSGLVTINNGYFATHYVLLENYIERCLLLKQSTYM